MKKILSMILALAMILSLGVTAFAEESNWEGSTENTENQFGGNVTAKYNAGSTDDFANAAKVYFVQISWNQTQFATYSEGTTTYSWNATGDNALTYTANTTGKGWSGSSVVEVTVTNYSNAAVTATVSHTDPSVTCTDESGWDKTTMSLDSAAKNIAKADDVGTAQSDMATLTLTPTSDADAIQAETTMSTITVTLSK